MGLLGGAHCAVMCGPVASVACRRPAPSLAFNLGRVATYGAFGLLAGSLSPFIGFALRPIAAIALVGLGLHLAGVSRVFTVVEKIGGPLWHRLQPLARKPLHPALLGAVWGFVPCGLVYSALALAATSGSTLAGALTMLAFGAGTLPIMTAMGMLAAPFGRFFGRVFVRRLAGVLVVLIGLHQARLAFAAADLSMLTTPSAHACCPGHRR
jgi:sulfite exporter TauE/SafE